MCPLPFCDHKLGCGTESTSHVLDECVDESRNLGWQEADEGQSPAQVPEFVNRKMSKVEFGGTWLKSLKQSRGRSSTASQPCAPWSRARSRVPSSSWEQWRVAVNYIQLAGSMDGSHLALRLQRCLWSLDPGLLTQVCNTVCGSKNSEIWNGLQFHIVRKGEKSYYPFRRKCIMASWRKRVFVSCYLHSFDSTFTR